jgi:hypothetical protein
MLRSCQRQTVNLQAIEHVIARMNSRRSNASENIEIGEYIELDSHANTSVIGNNYRIISYTNKTCQVTPYHPSYDSMQHTNSTSWHRLR